MYNNVPCVGHAHPRVAEAVARQARQINVNMRYLHPGPYRRTLPSLPSIVLPSIAHLVTN